MADSSAAYQHLSTWDKFYLRSSALCSFIILSLTNNSRECIYAFRLGNGFRRCIEWENVDSFRRERIYPFRLVTFSWGAR